MLNILASNMFLRMRQERKQYTDTAGKSKPFFKLLSDSATHERVTKFLSSPAPARYASRKGPIR